MRGGGEGSRMSNRTSRVRSGGESVGAGGRRSWATTALVAILGVAVFGSTVALTSQRGRDDYALLDPIIDVLGLVRRYAAVPPEDEALKRGAIRGMLEALDDDYAAYVPPALNERFNQELTGEYVGIGAEVIARDAYLEIVTPLEDSPAVEAGLMAGDRVVEIDGEPTAGKTTQESIELVKGTPGTTVVLTVERDGEIVDIPVERGRIVQRSVRGFARERGGDGSDWRYLIDGERRIAYIRLSRFAPATMDEFREALRRVRAPQGDLGGLVLDLRFNPGGLLDTAVELADLFLDEGVIVSTNGRAYEERVERAGRAGTLPAFPLVVLVNDASASASEVLAGALQENGRAKVLGTRTFGKGSVQSVRPLSGAAAGAVLKLTEQLYYLPSGRSIQRLEGDAVWGVDPSPGFFLPMGDAETASMLAFRREQEIIGGDADAASEAGTAESDGPGDEAGDGAGDGVGVGGDGEPSGPRRSDPRWSDPRWSDPGWIESTASDSQLAAALRALRARLETGEWAPPGDPDRGFDPALAREIARAQRTRERLRIELERLDDRIETLSSADPGAAENAGASIDLWPDGVSVRDGVLVVYDAAGDEVARLSVENPNLERWLINAGVRPVSNEDEDGDGGGR